MADRKPIIAGNWKMNMTHTDAIALVRTGKGAATAVGVEGVLVVDDLVELAARLG